MRLLVIENCLQCRFSKRILSPATGDSFDWGDEDLICLNPVVDAYRRKILSDGHGQKHLGCYIAVAERVIRERDAQIPEWCPLEKA